VSIPAIYEVTVTHSRRMPAANRFRSRSYLWLIDPADPPRLPWLLRPFARFDSRDHLDVRGELSGAGVDLDGATILMLANARVLGYVFNPISVYWCYDRDGVLVAQVAEVHNTYGGRHAYLLLPDHRGRSQVDKALYVSPFYPVDGHYELVISEPGERISVAVTLHRDRDAPFVAALTGQRRTFSVALLLRMLLRYPLAPLRTSAQIRYQGIKLWLSGLPVQPREPAGKTRQEEALR
jgi:DUF1365 family protein